MILESRTADECTSLKQCQTFEELELVLLITRITSKIDIPYLAECNPHIRSEEYLILKISVFCFAFKSVKCC